ncbi:MAG: hypothetical protein SFU25_01950 [Candidatus Caenarcaniphilales bacterium]|nr:hypothetical protein [Candidatus Caenarcaniphilales bacterium]
MKKKEIKYKPKKVKADPDKWAGIVQAIIKAHKNDFSIIKRLWEQWVKKSKREPEKEVCREIIQRMDQRKVPVEEAQQIAINSAQQLQTLQKELPRILIYLLGGGTMVICALVFLFLRAPKTPDFKVFFSDINVILWLLIIAVNLFIFIFGLRKRKIFADNLMLHSILSQAGAAYAASKAPGKGGSMFEAYHYLDVIRDKNKQAFDKKFGWGKKK